MTTSEALSSRKRKRDSSIERRLVCTLSESGSGPILVSYPAVQGPPSIAFQRYAHKKTTSDKEYGNVDDPRTLVVGETEDVEFVSNTEETAQAANAGCRYLIAIFDREKSSLSISPKPQFPYILTRTVKNLKSAPLSMVNSANYFEAKTALGEAFGTKKFQAALRARARKHIDIKAMEDVMDHLREGIDKGASNLLTKEEAQGEADVNRLIPPYDATTSNPEDIYPLHGIIPEAEWKALSVSAFDETSNFKERMALVPHKSSDWIRAHITSVTGKSSNSQKRKLKIVVYIAAMFAFRKLMSFVRQGEGIEKHEVVQRMSAVPTLIAESLLARFSEVPRGATSHISTAGTELNLLSHVFALCLQVDGFASDTSVLAHDLSMTPRRVNQIFKSLGCKFRNLGEEERRKLGLSNSTSTTKFAVLSAPVSFPKANLKRRT